MSAIAARLAALGVVLPTPAAPVANYVGAVKAGSLVVVSGQLPLGDGKLDPAHIGKLKPGAPLDAAKAATPAPPSASPICRSTPSAKWKAFSRSRLELGLADGAAHRPSRLARRRPAGELARRRRGRRRTRLRHRVRRAIVG